VIAVPAAGGPPPVPKPWYRQLYFWVLVAIAGGAAVGHFAPEDAARLKWLGDGFIKLVKSVISPVIFLTVAGGIVGSGAGTGELKGTGRVALKAFGYFIAVSTLALVLGLIVANVVRPGAGMGIDPATLNAGAVEGYAAKAHASSVTGFVLGIVPDTLVSALTSGSVLQALFCGILFGVALVLVGEPAAPAMRAVDALTPVVFRIVGMLMALAPLGAFGAIAFTVGEYGAGSLVRLGGLVATFYATSILFVVVVLGAVARLHGFSVLRLIRYLKDELLLVLGTSSSEAALPALIGKMEAAGCDRAVVGLVVPTGYSFNLDGTNIYMTLAALFIAQACGVPLSLGDQLVLMGVAILSSKGAAGVTGAGFITLAATLSAVPAVPLAGMTLILGVDRLMSECRSLTNFIGNAVATVVVARWEGRLDREKLRETLSPRAARG